MGPEDGVFLHLVVFGDPEKVRRISENIGILTKKFIIFVRFTKF